MSEWTPDKFSRRTYGVEGDSLDKAKNITVTVKVDSQTIFHGRLREPGILAIVSKPDEQGIQFELVEPGGQRYTDYPTPEGLNRTLPPEDWQIEALGLKP